MSQAGLLYGFSPSTEKAAEAPHSSSPVFLLLFFPSPVHNQSPSLPGSSQLAMVMDLLERPIACPAQQGSARLPSDPLPCQAVSSTEGKEGLPAHHLGQLTGQDSVPLPSHIWRNAGVNKTQTLTLPPAISEEEGKQRPLTRGQVTLLLQKPPPFSTCKCCPCSH